MFCLPLKKGKCTPLVGENNVYNFFPTDEVSSIQGLLHLSFDLSRNRKKLQMWGNQGVSFKSKKCAPENVEIVNQICKLLADVIDDELVPPETTIEVFKQLNQYKNASGTKGKPLVETQMRIINFIFQHPFLPIFGGGLGSLNQSRTWENGFLDCLIRTKNMADYFLVDKNVKALKSSFNSYGCKLISIKKH